MNTNLTTAYMAGEVERSLLESKATKQRRIDEAVAANTGRSLTNLLRHRIAMLLVSVGERLDGQSAPEYRSRLDDSLNPVK